MKTMFNVATALPHNLLQTNPCIRHDFLTQVFRKRAAQLHLWALSCATFSGLLWNSFSLKNPHKKTMCCEARPLLPFPIMQTVASVPCLLPLVYAKRAQNNTTSTFWPAVNRPLSTILQTGDICRIFHELQHSLTRLQYWYRVVTVLMGW
jgi:hypothetical protein